LMGYVSSLLGQTKPVQLPEKPNKLNEEDSKKP
jgi:hypothetical protein